MGNGGNPFDIIMERMKHPIPLQNHRCDVPKFHARGPVGLDGLTSIKWIVFGDGHVR